MKSDTNAEQELMARLESQRGVREEQERMVAMTPEWLEYERDVTEVTNRLEEEWLASEEPISAHTVARDHARWDREVEKVQKKHAEKNALLKERYRKQKMIGSGGSSGGGVDHIDISPEYRALLDKYS